MKGDFTRFTHDPTDRYTAVLKQQGRVDLDADWNEQVAIQQYLERTEAKDVIGPCGAPRTGGGFEIIDTTETEGQPDLEISAGRMYVDGILCELDAMVTYLTQKELPDPEGLSPEDGRTDLVYLDVWERHVTAIEDPGIREVALGGPDTTTRVKTVWQVKVRQDVGAETCADAISDWPPPPSGGRLSTEVDPTTAPTSPCSLSPAGGYRGLENQFYRVEIHDGGNIGTATFKWSRDNGSVVFAAEDFVGGQPTDRVQVKSLGRDRVQALRVGDWVEVLDDDTELSGQPGTLAQITDVDEADRIITLSKSVSGYGVDRHAKVRRWDQPSDAITVQATTFELENGISVQFSGNDFRTGDYWVFAARTITGSVEELTQAPPQGIQHHYCRLALITWRVDDGDFVALIRDCRPKFPPLTELTSLYHVSGDGQESMPGFDIPRLLEVRVASGGWTIEGATVRFVAEGDGRLAQDLAGLAVSSTDTIEVVTGPDGIAGCAWQLEPDPAKPSQQVTATLLDADGNPVRDKDGNLVHVIRFNANLSVASQVAYDSGTCLGDAATVKDALDQLCQNVTLYYVSGDGQEGMPGTELPGSLEVRVANGGFPVPEAQVVFKIVEGVGTLTSNLDTGDGVLARADADGLASCRWQLDDTNAHQRVEAWIEGVDSLRIGFNANLSVAEQVAYTPSPDCTVLDGVDTVQEAIDRLCEQGTGGPTVEPGVHVVDVLLLDDAGDDKPLENDTLVPIDTLVRGIRVKCDQEIDPQSVFRNPVFFVTLEMPSPTNASVETLFGYRPLILAAEIQVRDEDPQLIAWSPIQSSKVWLQESLFQTLALGRVLARMTLKGNFIWAKEDPLMYLDGEGFGKSAGPATEPYTAVGFPSGDGRRGGDLEMWFWLVSKMPKDVVLEIVEVDDNELIAGGTTTVTLRLDGPAPPGGAEVTLNLSQGGIVAAPTTVVVPPGEDTVTVEIEALPVDEPTPVVLRARYGGVTRQRTVRVQPAG